MVGFINQISQILQPVAHGIGFTVLPQSALDNFKDKHKVKALTPNNKVIETLYLIKKKSRVLPARYQTINALIKAN